jgi:hypothetical protein
MPYISVHVDADEVLPEFDTKDLQNELATRQPARASDTAPAPLARLTELHYAIKFGLNDRVLEIARIHVNEQLGTAL